MVIFFIMLNRKRFDYKVEGVEQHTMLSLPREFHQYFVYNFFFVPYSLIMYFQFLIYIYLGGSTMLTKFISSIFTDKHVKLPICMKKFFGMLCCQSVSLCNHLA